MSIQNSVVLITGANRGIGAAFVKGFLEAGAKKIYLGVRNPDSVKEVIAQNPDKLDVIQLDVTNPDNIKAAAKKATDVSILVNNAGILFMEPLESKNTVDNARKEMDVNYFGPLQLSQAFYPILKANKGTIVTVSSIVGHTVMGGIVSYSASKFAVQALILGQRVEWGKDGIKVVGVYPGPIDTDMADQLDMPKEGPEAVAAALINAIENDEEDVFPDAFSKDLYAQIRADFKAVEKQMAEAFVEEAQAA